MTTTEAAPTAIIGQRMLRREDPALLTGEARFTNDLVLPGALHLALARSPHAHARIVSIDTGRGQRRAGRGGRVHRRRPRGGVGRTDAVRLAGHRRHEEPAPLSAGHRQGVLRR